MEIRIQYIFLASFITISLAFAPTLSTAREVKGQNKEQPEKALQKEQTLEDASRNIEATKIVEPEIKRRQIDIADIDAQDMEIGLFVGQMNVEDFGTNTVVGLSLAYHVTEDIFVMASYGQTDADQTSFEAISGARLLTDDERELQYYDLNLGVNLLPGEGFIGRQLSYNSAFYGLIGVGSTDFAGDQRFTVSAAAGYRIVLKDWLALHVEVKDHVFDNDILGDDKTTHNISYKLGFSVFF